MPENLPYADTCVKGIKPYRKPSDQITEEDVKTGKNYLDEQSFRKLEILYELLFLFAENKILNGEQMTLGKWEFQLNTVLVANGYESFGLYKNYTRRAADQKAKEEFRKFRNTNIIHKDKVKSISSNHSMKKDNKRTKGD